MAEESNNIENNNLSELYENLIVIGDNENLIILLMKHHNQLLTFLILRLWLQFNK